MGFIRESFGKACVESRRESFILHVDYEWNQDYPHPEYAIEDLDDIIAALRDYREHLNAR